MVLFLKRLCENVRIYGFQGVILLMVGVVSFIVLGLYPFGSRSYFHNDLWSQYMPFSVQGLSFGPSSYAFNMSFDGTVMYYLMSPFTHIYRLVSDPFIGMTLLIFVKLWAGVASMYWVLSRKFMDHWPAFGFAFIYISFSWITTMIVNPIWLDVVYVLPLLAYGILDILNGKWSVLFIVSFTWMCWVNFAMGLMCAIFVALFYMTFSKLHHGRFFESFWLMAHVVLTSIFLVFPYVVKVVGTIGRAGGSDTYEAFDWTLVLSRVLVVLLDNARLLMSPGTLVTITANAGFGFAGMFLMYNLLVRRHRHLYYILTLYVILAIVYTVPLFDFLFSGMIDPIGNPARYAFAFMSVIFFLIVDAYRDDNWSFSKFDLLFYVGAVGVNLAFATRMLKGGGSSIFYDGDPSLFWGGDVETLVAMAVVAVVSFMVLYVVYLKDRRHFWPIIGVFSTMSSLLLAFGINMNSAIIFGSVEHKEQTQVLQEIVSYDALTLKHGNPLAYDRLDVDVAWGSNLGLYSEYPVGTQLYSSGVPSTISHFVSDVGLLDNPVVVSGHSDFAFLNNFLNITMMVRHNRTELDLPVLSQEKNSTLYENPYTYGVGFYYDDVAFPDGVNNRKTPNVTQSNITVNMNQLLTNIGYSGEAIERVMSGSPEKSTSYTVNAYDGYDYVMFVESEYDKTSAAISVNHELQQFTVFEHSMLLKPQNGKLFIDVSYPEAGSSAFSDAPFTFGIWAIPHETKTFKPSNVLEVQPDGTFRYRSNEKEPILLTMVDSPSLRIKNNGRVIQHTISSLGFVAFESSGNPDDIITIEL